MIKFLCSFCLIGGSLVAGDLQKQMIQDLEVIKHHFEVNYAPLAWKEDHLSCDLNRAFEKAKSEINESTRTKQFQRIVKTFLNQIQDYHVAVTFYSTEAARLPFSVKGIGERYFIDWIDPIELSNTYYAMRVGDELLQFDNRPIGEVMAELIETCGHKSNPKTDRRIAELKLTNRLGMAGDSVPQGPILITFLTKEGKTETCQIHWYYTPEHIANPFDFLTKSLFKADEVERPCMINPHRLMMGSEERKGGLGANQSFLPNLGETLWVNEEQKWHAYIYRHPSGKSIGYIRIPQYEDSLLDVKDFGEIINHLEQNSEALVIDQLHNHGGYVDNMYELASILAIVPMKAPYHRIKINQRDAMAAHSVLEKMKMDEWIKPMMSKEEDLPNYQQELFFKSFYELILNEWNSGHSLTQPTPIMGIDLINPHPKYRYTKPILFLIDEMDFSGGDFMPAILQDNGRAILFGNKTAGAGGFVRSFQFPNTNGISRLFYTASIAERVNAEKIENLGVKPDIEYNLTIEDLQNDYQGYVQAVNEAIQNLVR